MQNVWSALFLGAAIAFLGGCTTYDLKVEKTDGPPARQIGAASGLDPYYKDSPYYLSIYAKMEPTPAFSPLCGASFLDRLQVQQTSRSVMLAGNIVPTAPQAVWMPMLSISKSASNDCGQQYNHLYLRPQILVGSNDHIQIPIQQFAKSDSNIDVGTSLQQAAKLSSAVLANDVPVVTTIAGYVATVMASDLGKGAQQWTSQVMHYQNTLQTPLDDIDARQTSRMDQTFVYKVSAVELDRSNQPTSNIQQIGTLSLQLEWRRTVLVDAIEQSTSLVFPNNLTPVSTYLAIYNNGQASKQSLYGYVANQTGGAAAEQAFYSLGANSDPNTVRATCQSLRTQFLSLGLSPMDTDASMWIFMRDAPIGSIKAGLRNQCLDPKAIAALQAMGLGEPNS